MESAPVAIINSSLKGENILRKSTRIGDLKNLFAAEETRAGLKQDEVVYEVEAYLPVNEGTLGGLYWGITKLNPGKIGDEYYMTRGHFHSISDRAEYYWGLKGNGMLLLMDRDRKTRAEIITPGSLHYIPAHTAHRVANTGDELLAFAACWPADAGHDYDEIAKNGFSARLVAVNGQPQLIPAA